MAALKVGAAFSPNGASEHASELPKSAPLAVKQGGVPLEALS